MGITQKLVKSFQLPRAEHTCQISIPIDATVSVFNVSDVEIYIRTFINEFTVFVNQLLCEGTRMAEAGLRKQSDISLQRVNGPIGFYLHLMANENTANYSNARLY